jgi:predicted acylesterase/phospholipase RssA
MVEPSSPAIPAPGLGRVALCLCGGGITGAMYELGALSALDDFFAPSLPDGSPAPRWPFYSNCFDIFIGTSAGSFVATAVCAGISPRRLGAAVLTEARDDLVPAHRSDVFRFDLSQAWDVSSKLALILGRAAGRLGRMRLAELWEDLDDALPAGIFSLRHYERFLRRFLRRHGLPTRFCDLPRELYITANDLDSGHRVVFGGPGHGPLSRVPIEKAICASSAIPIFFQPVRIGDRDYIDGGTGKADHVDVAIRRGATLVLVINPMVPIRNDPHGHALPAPTRTAHYLRDKGLLTVYDQTTRMSIKARLHQGLRRWQAQRPDVDILLLEPDERERDMFLQNPMSFTARRELVHYGYESVASLLRAAAPRFAAAFARHGIGTHLGGLSNARSR